MAPSATGSRRATHRKLMSSATPHDDRCDPLARIRTVGRLGCRLPVRPFAPRGRGRRSHAVRALRACTWPGQRGQNTTRRRPRWPLRVSGARARMNDRRPCSLLQIRGLGHGIHDCPDSTRATSARSPSGSIPTRRDCRSTVPLTRCSWSSRGASRSSGAARTACRPSSARVTPPRRIPGRRRAAGGRRGRHLPRAGEPGLGPSDQSCVMKLSVCKLQVASNNSLWFKEADYVQDNPDHRHQ